MACVTLYIISKMFDKGENTFIEAEEDNRSVILSKDLYSDFQKGKTEQVPVLIKVDDEPISNLDAVVYPTVPTPFPVPQENNTLYECFVKELQEIRNPLDLNSGIQDNSEKSRENSLISPVVSESQTDIKTYNSCSGSSSGSASASSQKNFLFNILFKQ